MVVMYQCIQMLADLTDGPNHSRISLDKDPSCLPCCYYLALEYCVSLFLSNLSGSSYYSHLWLFIITQNGLSAKKLSLNALVAPACLPLMKYSAEVTSCHMRFPPAVCLTGWGRKEMCMLACKREDWGTLGIDCFYFSFFPSFFVFMRHGLEM